MTKTFVFFAVFFAIGSGGEIFGMGNNIFWFLEHLGI
jgi:hypothetical protein